MQLNSGYVLIHLAKEIGLEEQKLAHCEARIVQLGNMPLPKTLGQCTDREARKDEVIKELMKIHERLVFLRRIKQEFS